MKRTMTILLLLALCAALCSCSVNMYSYDDSRRYTAGGTTVTGRVDALDVSWVDGAVAIGYHDGQGVILAEDCRRSLDADDELHWWLDGGTLRVKYASSGFRMGVNLNKELTVLLPRDLALEELTVNVVSSDVQVEARADEMKINTVSGNLLLDGGACRVTADTVSGSMMLHLADAPEKVEVNSVSGSVTIALPETAGFTAEVDTVSGDVRGSLPMTQDGRNRYVSGDGACRISVHTVSGNVTLDALR